jgi:hypothetical protein
MTIEEYYADFRQDLLARAGSERDFTRSVFVDHMCTALEEQGAFTGFSQTDYKNTSKGYAVDAWSWNEAFSHLFIISADFRDSHDLENMTKTDISTSFNRLSRFFEASQKESFAAGLDESMPVTELAWRIAKPKTKIGRLTLVLLSDAQMSSRVASLPTANVAGVPTAFEVWDFGRMFRLESSGREREDIEVDFTKIDKDGLRCLPAFVDGAGIQSYLLVLPGAVLADLYKNYGERLLEQNVRTFLQFRGPVNKGILNTIVQEPHMFFPYNNGISATAEEVATSEDNERLLSARNLQIVNGGQTTAAIFTSAHGKDKADLSRVYVQVKLSVVPSEKVEQVVPKISEYANTQNKVSAADFFSNHPFHLRVEDFSRRLWAPSPDGGVRETHWFYERARGQYINRQANLKSGEQKTFAIQNPRGQMFTKTDLAKVLLSFEELPHVVSLGAQKAFAGSPRIPGFVGFVAKEWEKDAGLKFNEFWFKCAIAKVILFKSLDRLILGQAWYSGYKANIVTYTLAKFASMVRETEKCIDFLGIWDKQSLPDAVAVELVRMAKDINDQLLNPPENVGNQKSNTSEWAKLEQCWDIIKNQKATLGNGVKSLLIDAVENQYREKSGGRTQIIQDSIQAQTYVFQKGAKYWSELREWDRINKKLSPKEGGILDIACSIPKKYPSEIQSPILIEAEKRALRDGFFVKN